MNSNVYSVKSNFDMCGQRISSSVNDTGEVIAPQVLKKLVKHAIGELVDCGFEVAMNWKISAYTLNSDRHVYDREYTVRFTNNKESYIELSGIAFDKGGKVILDHGFHISK